MTYVSPPLELPDLEEGRFDRVDLQIHGVGHRDASYQVLIFLNNAQADRDTPREEHEGYAGSYWVFGHGGCVGDSMHCHVPEGSPNRYDLRPPHKLTPQVRVVTITPAWQTVTARHPDGASVEQAVTITLVAVNAVDPDGTRREDASELLSFEQLSLVAYSA